MATSFLSNAMTNQGHRRCVHHSLEGVRFAHSRRTLLEALEGCADISPGATASCVAAIVDEAVQACSKSGTAARLAFCVDCPLT